MTKAKSMKLEVIRNEIDILDGKLLRLIKRRMILVQKISAVKKAGKIKLEDKKREKEILSKIKYQANSLAMDKAFVTEIFRLLINQSKKIQNETV